MLILSRKEPGLRDVCSVAGPLRLPGLRMVLRFLLLLLQLSSPLHDTTLVAGVDESETPNFFVIAL